MDNGIILNNATFYLGDCLEVMCQLPEKTIDLIILDPPYNIGKDVWDKIDNYFNWIAQLISTSERQLKDNGSLYLFHNNFLSLVKIQTGINDSSNLIFKQLLIWNKRFLNGKQKGFLDGFIEVDSLRNYQKMAEYILYYTFQDSTGLTKIMGDCVYPIRDYIRSEIERAKGKISFKEINEVLGVAGNGGGVASAVLSLKKAVPCFITKKHYLKLREWLNNDNEYEYLRNEYEDLRYTFNNQKTHHSVWDYEGDTKKGHLTPKPVKLLENIIEHSSNKHNVVLDPTMGSGTTAIACHRTNRKFIGIEKEPKYFKMAVERYKNEVKQLRICDINH